MQIAVIVNPVSGAGRRRDVGARRVALASAHLRARGHDADVRLTDDRGHARDLAAAAVAGGAELVCAWGGDGTVNEVGSALAGTDVPLGIVPSGSGNGLARELGMPLDPAAALDTILSAPVWRMDAGELAGRWFFNLAGIGLDAGVARRFNLDAAGSRGLARYVRFAVGEFLRYDPPVCTIHVDGDVRRRRPLVLVFANARQYGYGALVAPRARLDDGRLDVVTVPCRSGAWTLWHAAALFTGGLPDVPGVEYSNASTVTVEGDGPLPCHVDGETVDAGACVRVRVRPGALLIRAPAAGGR